MTARRDPRATASAAAAASGGVAHRRLLGARRLPCKHQCQECGALLHRFTAAGYVAALHFHSAVAMSHADENETDRLGSAAATGTGNAGDRQAQGGLKRLARADGH